MKINIHLCYSPSQSLLGLAESLLGVKMTKDRRIRCGDWEAKQLSHDQVVK